MREQRIVLEDEPRPALLRRQMGHVAPVQGDAPTVGAAQASNHPEQGAFAAAAGAEQHEQLPVLNF